MVRAHVKYHLVPVYKLADGQQSFWKHQRLSSRNSFRRLHLVGFFSFLRALASICLILSLVTSNSLPTSSSVLERPSSRPKRRRRTFSSLSVSVCSTRLISSFRRPLLAYWLGERASLSSTHTTVPFLKNILFSAIWLICYMRPFGIYYLAFKEQNELLFAKSLLSGYYYDVNRK